MWVPFIPLLPFNPESCENGGFVWPLTLSGQTPQYLSQAPEASLPGSAASTPFASPSTCNSIPSQHSGIARGEAILTLKVKQYHPKGQSAVGPRDAFDDLAGPNELFMQLVGVLGGCTAATRALGWGTHHLLCPKVTVRQSRSDFSPAMLVSCDGGWFGYSLNPQVDGVETPSLVSFGLPHRPHRTDTSRIVHEVIR